MTNLQTVSFYKTKASATRARKAKKFVNDEFEVVQTPRGWMARSKGARVSGFNNDGNIDLRDGAQMGIIATIAAIVSGEYDFDDREPIGNDKGVTVNELAEFVAFLFDREVRGVKGTVRTQLSKIFGSRGDLNKIRDGREIRYSA